MIKAHSPINWENEPSYNTPINETNLNKMDSTIGVLDDRIIEQETSKLDKSTAYTMVKDISFNENNGVFTVTRLNGSTFTIDTRLEKIAINFKYDYSTQKLIVTLIDGTTQSIDMSALLTQYEFTDSATLDFSTDSSGKVTATIKSGSITEDMLQPNYLAEIKVETAKSAQSMANAKISENNAKQSELNAKASEEQALEYSNNAQPVAQSVSGNNPTATNSTDGSVIYLNDAGYTNQKVLTGKNQLPDTAASSTVSGVSFIVKEDNKRIVIDGKATAAINHNLITDITLEPGDYILSGYSGGASNRDCMYLDIYTEGTNRRIVNRDGDIAFTWLEGEQTANLGVYMTNGYAMYSQAIYPMIRKATVTDATYEQASGGVAQPSPDNPIRIGGLADKGYFDGVLLQGRYDITNLSGAFVSSADYICCKNSVDCVVNDVVCVKYEENVNITFLFYDENNTCLETWSKSTVKEFSFTIKNENIKKMRWHIQRSGITPSTAKHICVTINGNYAIPIKTTGKNIFGGIKLAQALVDSGSTNVVLDESAGTVTYSYNTNHSDIVRRILFDKFKENAQYTIILKGNHTEAGSNNGYYYTQFVIRYTDGTSASIKAPNTGNFTQLFVSEENKTISRIGYTWSDGDTITLNYNQCGIFEGVITEEEFEEYQESVANIPITGPLYEGDYIEVYADGSGQIYRKYHRFKPTTINNVYGSSSGWIANSAAVVLDEYCTLSEETPFSNYFIFRTTGTLTNGKFTFGNGKVGAYTHVFFNIDGLTSLEEYQAWLDEHSDLEFVYELTTPTSTPLTAEQVAEFMKLQTFNSKTHITADGEVTVRYYCDNASGETAAMLQKMIQGIS